MGKPIELSVEVKRAAFAPSVSPWTWYSKEAEAITGMIRAAIAAHDAEREKEVCEWTWSDDPALYETECGKEFCTLDDEQLDSSLVFCSFCGKRINVAQ
jgi:hypothetical protein